MTNIKIKLLALTVVTAMTASLLGGCSTGDASTKSPPIDVVPPAPNSSPLPAGFDLSHEISVISREDGSGTRGAFIELFGVEEKGTDGSKTDRTTEEATIVSKTDVMLQTVAGDPWSVGYVSLGSLSDSVKAVKIDGVAASSENMLSGSYKISRPFNIATVGEPQGLAKDFISFILSNEGQTVVAKSYVAIGATPPAYSGNKPSGKLVVGGSSSVFPIMEKLAEAYAVVNPNAKLEIQSSDSSAGMSGTVEGIFDIGMASRELKESEKAKLIPVSIAIDGIAVIVSPENPTDNLTSGSVKSIFMGETATWSNIAD